MHLLLTELSRFECQWILQWLFIPSEHKRLHGSDWRSHRYPVSVLISFTNANSWEVFPGNSVSSFTTGNNNVLVYHRSYWLFSTCCNSQVWDSGRPLTLQQLFFDPLNYFIFHCNAWKKMSSFHINSSGTGKGGTSIWGRKFEDEYSEHLKVSISSSKCYCCSCCCRSCHHC